ncbi:MAG: sodium:proton antiporter [Caldilineaceae bacterium]
MNAGIAILALLIALYAAVADRIGRWSITMPMVFVIAGFVLGPGVTNLLPLSPNSETVKTLTEITLAVLLFADASTLQLSEVRKDAGLPARLLAIGLPLTIVCGAATAYFLQPQEGWAFACLLGTILAPTDAALGLPIFNNPRVPVRIRRALNVESGLNDGIATPFVLLFLALAAATDSQQQGHWVLNAVEEIVLAGVAGSVVGFLGSWVLTQTTRRGWSSEGSERLGIFALALAAYFVSLAIGGNGFIAAFVGGIVFRHASHEQFVEPTEFTETLGTFLSLVVWAIFGAVLVADAFRLTQDWRPIAYAIASLTLVRMLPVGLAMIGTGLRRDTVGLMGWFGPRGLASVVFTLLALARFQELNQPVDILLAAATWTILLSVMAHGLSAAPLSIWYSRRLERAGRPLAETAEMPELYQRRQALEGRAST